MDRQRLFWIEDQAAALFTTWGVPWWITGFIWHGIYRGLAWVVSVMLPPMAIFFPCSPSSKTWAICRAWRSTWTGCSRRRARTASKR